MISTLIPGAILTGTLGVGALLFAEYRLRTQDAGVSTAKWTRLKRTAKPVASLCFVMLALLYANNAGSLDHNFSQLIIAGLVFCLLGDVLLMFSPPRAFLAGMGAFALGHIAYIGAFLVLGASMSASVGIAILGMSLLSLCTIRYLWPHLGSFRMPVAIYCLIIGIMVIASVATGRLPLIIGAVGFAISDIAVARDQFVTRKFFNKLWGLPLYYGAQMLLAASVVP